jgi:hypothetical protein
MSDVRLLSHEYNFGVNKGNLNYIASYIIFELRQVPCTCVIRVLLNVNIFYVFTE